MLAWDDLRFLLALSRAGSLARAGLELGVDHTTVGRRIEAVEQALGVRLFVRSPSGYGLTSEGNALLPGVARIEDAVLALERATIGRDASLTGVVRVTAGESFGSRYLAPRLGLLRGAHPGLTVELETGVRPLDLARREADVAIRHFRSTQADLVVRKAAVIGWSIYCSRAYAERAGRPTAETLGRHDRIGADAQTYQLPPEDAWFERVAGGGPVTFRSSSSACMLGATVAGLGIALLPCFMGNHDPNLVRTVLPDEPRRGIWLTVHRDLQHTPRVRAVLDSVAAMLAVDAELLRGDVGGEAEAIAVPATPPAPLPRKRGRGMKPRS